MNKVLKVVAIFLAVAMLAGCGLVELDDTKITVAKVNDTTITKAEFLEELNAYLAGYGFTTESAEIADQMAELKTGYLEAMIDNLVVGEKAKELGYDQISDEDRAKALSDRQAWYDEQLEELMGYFGEDVEDKEAEAKKEIESFLQEYYGISTIEELTEMDLEYFPNNKLYEEMTKDIGTDDEEIKANFDSRVQDTMEAYQEDIKGYISDRDNGVRIYYVPEGIFYIKHILVSFPQEKKDEIAALRGESKNAEADALRDEEAALIKEKVDEVYAKVQAGEDFDTLMAEYGEDPGMKLDAYGAEGYETYVGDETFYPEFASASQALTAVGQVSPPTITDVGYHIIKRVKDLESGPAEYDDEMKNYLSSLIVSGKKDEYYEELIGQWKEEMKITRYEDRL